MREEPSSSPIPSPNTTAIAKPARVIQSVWKEWNESCVRYSHIAFATASGVGRTKLETWKTRQPTSHSRKKPMVNTQGASAIFCF